MRVVPTLKTPSLVISNDMMNMIVLTVKFLEQTTLHKSLLNSPQQPFKTWLDFVVY